MRNSAGLPGAFRRAGDFFVLRRTWENMERNGKSLGKMFESKTNAKAMQAEETAIEEAVAALE